MRIRNVTERNTIEQAQASEGRLIVKSETYKHDQVTNNVEQEFAIYRALLRIEVSKAITRCVQYSRS